MKYVDLTHRTLYLCIHFLIDDKVVAGTPVTNFHSLAGSHNVLTHALRRPNERLTLTHS